MDKRDKKEEEIIQQWMREVPLEKPSASFMGNVMDAIEAKKSVSVYQPLVSKKGWFVIAAIFVASIALLYLYPMGGTSYFDQVALPKGPEFTNPFRGVEVSKTTLYAIGCLALFLVQLPFLKRMINKQYS